MDHITTRHHTWMIGVIVLLCAGIGYLIYTHTFTPVTATDTTSPQLRDLEATITVSGKVEALHAARMAFPMPGTVQKVMNRVGDEVQAGSIIASLTKDSLVANYTEAVHNLAYFKALKAALVRGPVATDREVSVSRVDLAKADLLLTIQQHDELVRNAYQTLLSSDLEAIPSSRTNNNTSPTITGNYLCDETGEYTLAIFRSAALYGQSYRLSGLEEGTFTVPKATKAPLGTCGLSIQFDLNETYTTDTWTIKMPNTDAASYLVNKQAYEQAKTDRAIAIQEKEDALTLTEKMVVDRNATPSREALLQADAQIAQAEALLAAREAAIRDYTIRAPFTGIIADIDIKEGEAADLTKTITMMQNGEYELIAQIPETDIASITVGDRADVVFDAQKDEHLEATITFISPLSNTRKGVAYFETRLQLKTSPSWMREGLNADIKMITAKRTQTLSIPRTYLVVDMGQTYVLIKEGSTVTRTPVRTGIVSTEGYVEVFDIDQQKTLTLPQ